MEKDIPHTLNKESQCGCINLRQKRLKLRHKLLLETKTLQNIT